MTDARDWRPEDEPIAPQEVTRTVNGERRTARVHVQFRVRLRSNCGGEWAHDVSRPVSFVGEEIAAGSIERQGAPEKPEGG